MVMDKGTRWDRMNPGVNNESPTVTLGSNNLAPAEPNIGAGEGTTFLLVVDTKLKTEKLKIGGQKVKATYYKVKIPKKSYKAPLAGYRTPVGTVVVTQKLKSDAKGKLYVSDTDVDVSQVVKKKAKTKIGDGTADPPGSLIIDIKTVTTHRTMGEIAMKEKATTTWTTGTSSLVVKGSKSEFEGMAFPEVDPSGVLPTPLVGEPLDLKAGTGTLVSTSATMNAKTIAGKMDILRGQVWVMKIKGKRGPGGPRPSRPQQRLP
jgi:hypothetical protein